MKETWRFQKISRDRGHFVCHRNFDDGDILYCVRVKMSLKSDRFMDYQVISALSQSDRDFSRKEDERGWYLFGRTRPMRRDDIRKVFEPYWTQYLQNKNWADLIELGRT